MDICRFRYKDAGSDVKTSSFRNKIGVKPRHLGIKPRHFGIKSAPKPFIYKHLVKLKDS